MEGLDRPRYILLLGLLLVPTALSQIDPCTIATPAVVPSLKFRTQNVPDIGLDDVTLTAGWYSATPQYDMVIADTDTHSPIDQCGSLYPAMVVRNSFIPSDTSTQDLTVTYYDFEQTTWDSMTIRVKDCGAYRMYELKPITMGSYCFVPGSDGDLCMQEDVPLVPDLFVRRPRNFDAFLNDSELADGWYSGSLLDISRRFVVDDPDFFHCGGQQPIWTNDPLPAADGMVHELTLNVFNKSGGDHEQFAIQVKNCGAFRIYNLTSSVPANSSYCFDFAHTTDEDPPYFTTVDPPPMVDVYHECVSNTTARIHILCDFMPDVENATSSYLVTFYSNGVPILKTVQVTNDTVADALITEVDLVNEGIYRYTQISCGVAVRSTETGVVGELIFSVETFFGIQVATPTVTITPGEAANILVKLNAPMSCNCVDEFCHIMLFLEDPNVQLPVVAGESSFIVTDFEEDEATEAGLGEGASRRKRSFNQAGEILSLNIRLKHMFPLKTKVFIDRERIALRMRISSNRNSFWLNGIFGSVDVRIREEPGRDHWREKSCEITCDPHVTTFDGRVYDFRYAGVFVAYKYCPVQNPHWYHDKHVHVKVQIKTESCKGDGKAPFCPCGIAVIAGHDVYVVSTCGTERYHGFTRCVDHVLHVESTDSLFKVWLPQGTRVEGRKVTKGSYEFLNIWIYPSALDVNSTCGLCGTLDDNCGNDLDVWGCHIPSRPYGTDCETFVVRAHEFTQQHSVPDIQSLFTPLEYGNMIYSDMHSYREGSGHFCFCGHKRWDNEADELCVCQQTHWWGDVIDTSCTIHVDVPTAPSLLLSDSTEGMNLTKETPADCQKAIEEFGMEFPMCESCLVQVANCIEDVTEDPFYEVGQTGWVDNARYICETNCQAQNDALPNPDPVLSNMCAFDCGIHGDCVEGQCVCGEGYGNDKCDTSRADKVELLGVRDFLCNWRVSRCHTVVIKPKLKAFVSTFPYTSTVTVTKSGERSLIFTTSLSSKVEDFMSLRTSLPQIRPTLKRTFRYSVLSSEDTDGSSTEVVAGRRKRSVENNDLEAISRKDEKRVKRQAAENETLVEGEGAFVLEYVIIVTTDNVTYSNPVTTYSFDATCIEYVEIDGKETFFLKPMFCFLDFECVLSGTHHIDDRCRMCLSERNPIGWSTDTNQTDCVAIPAANEVPEAINIAVIATSSAAVFILLILGIIFLVYRICRKALPDAAGFSKFGRGLGQKNPHFKPKEFLAVKKKHMI